MSKGRGGRMAGAFDVKSRGQAKRYPSPLSLWCRFVRWLEAPPFYEIPRQPFPGVYEHDRLTEWGRPKER